MQQRPGRFVGTIEFRWPFMAREATWEFFYRDFFTMFLRWTRPIVLMDGTSCIDPRLMRRRVRGRWQYRRLDERELRYILDVKNGTHC